MKLTTFDSSNMASVRKGDAIVSISRKGASSISKAGVERVEYGAENQIAFHQDQDEPNDWYMSLSESGFTLRDDKGSGSLSFNSTALANTMLDALNIDDDRAGFLLANEATMVEDVAYWALLTAKPIIKKRKKA